jgi:hypothetical protein
MIQMKNHWWLRALRSNETSELKAIEGTPYKKRGQRADTWYSTSAPSVAARRERFMPAWFNQPSEKRVVKTLYVTDGT